LSPAEEEILLAFTDKAEREVTFDWKRQGVEKKITKTFETGTDELTAIVLLGLDAGLRAGEIRQLEWDDVDFKNRSITLRAETTKTLQSRRVPVTARLAVELKKLPSYEVERRVFELKYFRRSFLTALRLAGIDGLEFRDLRRTFAKKLEGLGIAFTVLQKIMGHAAESVTGKHYLPATIDDVQDVADKLDARNARGVSVGDTGPDASESVTDMSSSAMVN
jgi:integrase